MIKEKDKPVVIVTESVYKKGKEVFDAVKDMEMVVAIIACSEGDYGGVEINHKGIDFAPCISNSGQ